MSPDPPPAITGQVAVTFTVTDLDQSAAWYTALFEMIVRRQYAPEDGSQRDICLVEPASGLEICLVEYATGAREPFDEFRPGLDHLEFHVAERTDLDRWAARLEALGIGHSGVKEPPYTRNAMLTFRDPDNIQLEFFWLAARV